MPSVVLNPAKAPADQETFVSVILLLLLFAIWMASPRKVRAVAGQLHKTRASANVG